MQLPVIHVMFSGYELSPILLPFVLSVVCSPVPLLFAEQRYKLPMWLLTMAIFIWGSAVAFRISATTVALETMWHTIRMLGPIVAGWCFFLFTAEYTDRNFWSSTRGMVILSIMPVLTVIIGATNVQHGLLRASVEYTPSGAFVMQFTPGIWYYIHSIYSYILVVVGLGWLLLYQKKSDNAVERKRQKAIMTFAAVLVTSTNVAYNIGLTTLDWTPVAGAAWAIMLVSVAQRHRAFGLGPLAQKEIVENLDSGVVTIDRSYNVISANPAMEKISCCPKEKLIGADISYALDIFETDIKQLIQSKDNVDELRTNDGRYYSLSTSTVTNTVGDELGKTISLTEVTGQVERKQKVEQQKEVLKEKNEELERKKMDLEKKNEKLDKFSEVVSHDLRNPISVILGNAEIIKYELSDYPDLQDRVSTIIDTTENMNTMIDELLELSRLGDDIQDTSATSLATVAESAWENVSLDQCDLNIVDDIEIDASASEMRRAFENLYRNAREHNEGEIEIRIGVAKCTSNGCTSDTSIYVSDTGSGIPDEHKDRVFDRGFTNSDSGTGFGLSIVSDIVEAHGWKITVSDAPNGGARFDITGIESSVTQTQEAEV